MLMQADFYLYGKGLCQYVVDDREGNWEALI